MSQRREKLCLAISAVYQKNRGPLKRPVVAMVFFRGEVCSGNREQWPRRSKSPK